MENIKVRKKSEILNTLEEAISDSDVRITNNMFNCSSSLIPNERKTEHNPASYVGWARTDTGSLMRLEGENRYGSGGRITLSLKFITVPQDIVDRFGLDPEPEVLYPQRESQQDFFTQP
jgi:hypothetical protein